MKILHCFPSNLSHVAFAALLLTLGCAGTDEGQMGDGDSTETGDGGSDHGIEPGTGGADSSSGGREGSGGTAGGESGGDTGSSGGGGTGGETGSGGDAGTGGDVSSGGDDAGTGGETGSGASGGNGGTGGGEVGSGGATATGGETGSGGNAAAGGTGSGGAGSHESCDEDNGGCGDPAFIECVESGGDPTCSDIDECDEDNGGCGSSQFYACSNNEGAPPTCSDIDECLLELDDCALAANCTNESPGFSCACKEGFSGDGRTCESEGCSGANPCAPGACSPTESNYVCDCPCGFAALGGTCVDLYPHIWFVDVGAPVGGNGECWATAFKNLKDALTVAEPGDAIWVAEGVYYPGTLRSDTFQIPSGVSLYGGFEGDETQLNQRKVTSNITILDGDIDKNRGAANYPTSVGQSGDSYHIVSVDAGTGSARLDGFTVRGGFANDGVGYGAGVYLKSGTLTVNAVVFTLQAVAYLQNRGASAYASGGTMIVLGSDFKTSNGAIRIDGANLVVNQTKFTPYTLGRAVSMNGGIATLTDCVMTFAPVEAVNAELTLVRTTMTAVMEAGAVNAKGGRLNVVDSILRNNSSNTNGAAIAAHAGAVLEVKGTLFENNLVQRTGNTEGAAIYGDSIDASISECTFNANRAGFDGINSVGGSGGGIFLRNSSSEIADNVFHLNYARGNGGAVVISGGSSLIDSSVFTDNSAYGNGGALRADAANVVISNSRFEESSCRLHGGAVDIGSGNVEIVGSQFTANSALEGGGAIHAGYSNWDHTITKPVVVAHSTFDAHTAAFGGLVFAQRHFHFVQSAGRSSYALNTSNSPRSGRGGIVFARFPVTIENSTFADFGADVSGVMGEMEDNVEPGAGALASSESVFYSDAVGAWVSGPGTATFDLSCVHSSIATGNNIPLSASPFVGWGVSVPLLYDLQLDPNSICKDQLTALDLPLDTWDLDSDGVTTEALPVDLANLPRRVGSFADLGAYEEQGVSP